MKCKLPNIAVTGLVLSDLFFNSPLENYNSFSPDDGDETEVQRLKQRNALVKDATEFAAQFEGQVTPEQLVEDFLGRV